MTRILRIVVGWTIVVGLVAVFVGFASMGHTGVPVGLLGRWKGGAHSNGPWYYAFSADGEYRTWPVRGPGTVNAGTVFVAGRVLTFSNGGAPITATWSLSGGTLLLDGETYVRA
jgi:hypothetical protein